MSACTALEQTSHAKLNIYQAPVTKDLAPTFKQVQFDATLKYNTSHKLYRPVTDPPYVGPPSAEIDDSWKALLGGEIP